MTRRNENKSRYKKTKVGWIPEEWECVPFTKLFDRASVPVIVEPEDTYQEIGIRSHCKGVFFKEKVTGRKIGNKRVFWCQPGTLVFNIVFAWEQAVAVLGPETEGLIASHRFPMYRARNGYASEMFYLWFFSSLRGKHGLALASPGGAGRNKTLGQGGLDFLFLPTLPLPEQERIAEVLSAWDRAIALTDRLIDAKQRWKKGLMQQLLTGRFRFTEFGKPARKKGELPKGWKKVRLGKLADISMGTSPSSDNYNNSGVGLPLIQGNTDIVNRTTNPTRWTSQVTTVCEPDDLIMSVRAPVGKIAKSQHKACVGRGACVIAIRGGHSKEFIFQILLDAETAWHRLGQGSTFACITGKEIRSDQFPVPLQREQRRIASCLSACDRIIQLLALKRDCLQEQKKGLMQKLLTGEVRVKTKVRRG